MQYLPVVNVLQSKAYLREPVQNVILAPILQLSAGFLLLFVLVFDSSLQIAAVCVVHNNAKFSLFGFVDFTEADDVGVLQHLKDLGLAQSLPSLILVHVLDIDLLDDCVLLIGLAFYKVRCSKRANAQCLHFLVRFVLLLCR